MIRTPRSSYRRTVSYWLVLATIGLSGAVSKATAQQSEQAVKAAFIANFIKFIEWPSPAFGSSADPIVIGVVGRDPFGKQLDDLVAGKSVGGRKVVVRRVTWSQCRDIQLLFVPASEAKNYDEISKLQKSPIVIVGETGDFASKYGVIGFKVENRRIAFDINPTAARSLGLTISSQLLQLATIVSRG